MEKFLNALLEEYNSEKKSFQTSELNKKRKEKNKYLTNVKIKSSEKQLMNFIISNLKGLTDLEISKISQQIIIAIREEEIQNNEEIILKLLIEYKKRLLILKEKMYQIHKYGTININGFLYVVLKTPRSLYWDKDYNLIDKITIDRNHYINENYREIINNKMLISTTWLFENKKLIHTNYISMYIELDLDKMKRYKPIINKEAVIRLNENSNENYIIENVEINANKIKNSLVLITNNKENRYFENKMLPEDMFFEKRKEGFDNHQNPLMKINV